MTPHLGYVVGLDEPEGVASAVLPANVLRVVGLVNQQTDYELPVLGTTFCEEKNKVIMQQTAKESNILKVRK